MTFSQTAKNEILRTAKNLKGCCVDAFLYAVFKTVGQYGLTKNGIELTVQSQNNLLLTRCQQLAKLRYGVDTQIKHENTLKMTNTQVFSATFDSILLKKFCLTFVDRNGLLQINDGVSKKFFSNQCCQKAFLMGVFVSVGSISVPFVSNDLLESKVSQRYHMEFSFATDDTAHWVAEILADKNFEFKLLKRKNGTVLYTKSSQTIADCLVFLTATNAKLELENLLIERSIRNNANRQSNCIYANIDKTLTASSRQILAVDKLEKSGKLSSLSPQLAQMATLRKQNPEASLAELATLADVTKSCVKHRLNKLIELSEEKP